MPLNPTQIGMGVHETPGGTVSFTAAPATKLSPITAGFLGIKPDAAGEFWTGGGNPNPGANPWDELIAYKGPQLGVAPTPTAISDPMMGGGKRYVPGGSPGDTPGATPIGGIVTSTGNPVARPPGRGGGPAGPSMGPGTVGGTPGGGMPTGGPTNWGAPGAPSPWGGTPQGDNENRNVSFGGLDPRLDSLYQFALQQAIGQYGNPNGQTFYGGPTVAQLTPDELAAQDMLRGSVGSLQGIASGATGLFDDLIARGRDPANDPTLNTAIQGTLGDMRQQVMDPGGIFSQIRGNAVAGGSYGGSRQGVLESLGTQRFADQVGRVSGDMRLTGRNQNIQNALSAVGQIPTITGAVTAPAGVLGAVGAQNRDMDQRNMDANLREWAYNVTEPDRRLDALFGRIGAAPLGGWQAGSATVGEGLMPGAGATGGGTSNAQNWGAGIAGAVSIFDILKRAGLFG